MQKKNVSTVNLSLYPKGTDSHFALTALCITCPTGFPFAEVEASGGEMWAEIDNRAVANGNIENLVYFREGAVT